MFHRAKKLLKFDKVKYFISGLAGFALDIAVLYVVSAVFFDGGAGAKILGLVYTAKLISSLIGITLSFYLNRTWTFQVAEKSLVEQTLKMALVFIYNLILANILYTAFFDGTEHFFGHIISAGLILGVANFMTSGTQMVINYFIYKFYVFKK